MFLEATLPNLQTAAENNIYGILETIGSLPQGESLLTPQLIRYRVAGITSPMFNGVGRVQLSTENADAAIEETIAYYREANVPVWFWWVGDQTQPADIGERLERHGLIHYEIDAPAMAVDLSQMDETTTTQPNFHISVVGHERDLRTWVQTFIAGFSIPQFVGDSWYDATLRTGFQDAPWRLYIGWLDQEPVGVSMLFPGAGIAGILAVATIPTMRGKGIGKAVTLRPLIDARAEGYKIGALFATNMGTPVYERIGFRQYGVINRYRWRQT